MNWRVLLQDRSGHTVYEVAGGQEGFIPITEWERGVRQEGKTCFYQVAMLAFGNTVLLRVVRTRNAMRDACALEIAMQPMILATPVRLDSFYFSV